MKKVFFLFVLALSLNAVTLQQGWNLVGVNTNTSTTQLITDSNEYIHVYDGSTWDHFSSTKTGTIGAGRGFWIKSSTIRTLNNASNVNSSNLNLNNEWELVTPISNSLNLSTQSDIDYAWKFSGGDANPTWSLFHPTLVQSSYNTFTNVEVGEGVWIKSTNAKIGNTPVFINNGLFSTVQKTATTATTTTELYEDIMNSYDLQFNLNSSGNTLNNFSITIKVNRSTSPLVDYYYTITVNSTDPITKPKVELSKVDRNTSPATISGQLTTRNVEQYVVEFLDNDSKVKLNFNKIVKYLIDAEYYSFTEMKDRFGVKADYTYQVFFTNLSPVNSSVESGYRKIEGVITIK